MRYGSGNPIGDGPQQVNLMPSVEVVKLKISVQTEGANVGVHTGQKHLV